MKRFSITTLLVTIALATMLTAAPAMANSADVGVMFQDGETYAYAYADAYITPTVSASVEYSTNNRLGFGLWYGATQGLYGRYELQTSGDGDDIIELGLWTSQLLSPQLGFTGLIGAQKALDKDDIWVIAGAEVDYPLTDSLDLLVGADVTLLKDDTTTTTWLGVGFSF